MPVTTGDVYQFNCGTLPAAINAGATYFNTPFGTSPENIGLVDGQMYYLSIFATSSATANFRVYDQLSFASQATNTGSLYTKAALAAGVVLLVKGLTKVSPALVAEVRQLTKHKHHDLSESERDLITLNRRVRELKTDELMPRFQTRAVETVNSTQLPAIHVTATRASH